MRRIAAGLALFFAAAPMGAGSVSIPLQVPTVFTWTHGDALPNQKAWSEAAVVPDVGGAGEVPLHCRPEIIAAFERIWTMGGSGFRDYEAGFRVDLVNGDYQVVYADMTYEDLRLAINIIRGVTVAIAHTHPDIANPRPLGQDLESPVPNYVVSRRELWVTDPETKTYRRVRRLWRRPC